MSDPELQLQDVSIRFGERIAADRVSFELQAGEFLAILGPSGSGKSTLLRMIGGQLAPDSGEIRLGGKSIAGLPPNKIDCATVFQDYALFPHMTVRQNVEFGLKMRGQSADERRARAEEMLALVGMESFADRSVRRLSGGERQRVATARALAVRPRVLLMDEPLGALDRLIKLRVQEEISSLLHELGVTTVYVTHDQREALVMADRIALMHDGVLEQIDDPISLVRRPANRFVAEFLGGSGNYMRGRRSGAAEEMISVETPIGTLLARPPREGELGASEVTVHVRPEELSLTPDPDGPAQVTSVAYTGEIAEIHLEVTGTDGLVAKQLGVSTLSVGEKVSVTVAPGLSVLLPDGDGVASEKDMAAATSNGGVYS